MFYPFTFPLFPELPGRLASLSRNAVRIGMSALEHINKSQKQAEVPRPTDRRRTGSVLRAGTKELGTTMVKCAFAPC